MKKKLAFSVSLGILCLWLAVRGIDPHEIIEAFRQVKWGPVLWLPLMMVVTFVFRARRMKIIFRPLKELKVGEIFGINAVGFLAINAFPLRLGEFVRPLLLKRRHNIPFSTGLASVAVERLFDGLVTLLALLIGLLGVPSDLGEIPYLGIRARTMAFTFAGILLPILAFVILAVAMKRRFLGLCERAFRFLPGEGGRKLLSALENFMIGLACLPNAKTFILLLLESVGVWAAMIISYRALLSAFGLNLPWTAPFCILGIAAVGVSIPAAPGFVGTYQLFVQAALAIYGIPKPVGLALSVVAHAINLVFVALMGLFYLPKMSTSFGSLYNEALEQKEKASSP